jgi:hypothetical protein
MTRTTAMLALLLAAPAARAAVVAAPGYAAHAITTPGTIQGGVVRRGGAILVGQGTYGTETIVRLDGTAATTVATGFNSLGGFDLDAAGTLYVTDNCRECPGATTGDTVYAIADALTRTTAATALGAEVVPAGTIPYAGDVLVAPGGALLVCDQAGSTDGRIVRVSGTTASDLITGLGYCGGLAITPGGTLLVGNVDASTFVGSVLEYALDGTPAGTLVGGLPGEYAHALDADGNLLVTGEYSLDCSGVLRAVAPDGTVVERAHGFCFSADVFFDAARNEALVLDGAASGDDTKRIFAICRDRDGDGLCDADDPCTGVPIAKPKLALAKLGETPGSQTLALKGAMTVPAAPALDPVETGVRVLVDGVVDATIPGGAFDRATKTGWKAKKGAFKYQNGQGGIMGIVKVAVKVSAKTPGLVQFAVSGKHGTYSVDPAALPRQATFIVDAADGQCGDAGFAGPAPVCEYDAGKGKLRCQ